MLRQKLFTGNGITCLLSTNNPQAGLGQDGCSTWKEPLRPRHGVNPPASAAARRPDSAFQRSDDRNQRFICSQIVYSRQNPSDYGILPARSETVHKQCRQKSPSAHTVASRYVGTGASTSHFTKIYSTVVIAGTKIARYSRHLLCACALETIFEDAVSIPTLTPFPLLGRRSREMVASY